MKQQTAMQEAIDEIIKTKLCTKCCIIKSLEDFHNNKHTKDGKTNWCSLCNKERVKKYYNTNSVSISKKAKIYRKKNREYYNKKNKEWNLKTGYCSDYQKKRIDNDPFFKFKNRLRTFIRNSVTKQGYTKNSKSFKILGCEYDFFVKYIESKFKEGMNWDNHGEWHLDHIIPISSAKNNEEVLLLNHYSNFQPLWAKDNLVKYNTNETYGGYTGRHR